MNVPLVHVVTAARVSMVSASIYATVDPTILKSTVNDVSDLLRHL